MNAKTIIWLLAFLPHAIGQDEAPDPQPTIATQHAVDASRDFFSERLWVDKTASFTVRARLLGVKDGKVRLYRTTDNTTVEVDLDLLSLDDQKYCVDMFNEVSAKLKILKENGLTIDPIVRESTEFTLEIVQEAIDALDATIAEVPNRDLTTFQRRKVYDSALARAESVISGRRAQVHFLVDDLEQLKSAGRSRRLVALTLTSPDIRIPFDPRKIDVWMDASETIQFKRGDVVRAIGRFGDLTRKTAATTNFYFPMQLANKSIVDDIVSYFENTPIEEDVAYKVLFSIESINRLPDAEAKTFLDANAFMQLK